MVISMSKYIFKLIGQNIECKEIYDNKNVRYITDYEEFKHILLTICRSDYILRCNYIDMSLKTADSVYILKDHEELLTHPEMNVLLENVKHNIEMGNFIDTTQTHNISRTPKRNSMHHGKSVIRVSLFALTILLMINPFVGKLLNEEVTEKNNQDLQPGHEIVIEKPIVDNTFEIDDGVMVIEHSLVMNSAKPEQNPKIDTAVLEFEELSNTEKAEITKENYYNFIVKKSQELGLDANLMLGIATEERGTHSREIDSGGGLGLMQIQYNVWLNHDLTYYRLNPDTGIFEQKSVKVTDERMRNLETNIETGCMIFQECLRYSKYNIPVAIQMYNMGYGTMQKILGSYAEEKGITIEDILKNPTDIGWTKYREGYPGDPEYLEKVNMWILDNTFSVKNVFTNEDITFAFTNENEQNNEIINTYKK